MPASYTALLLCGGQSSRMKTDKAFLAISSPPLASHASQGCQEPLFLHLLKKAIYPLPNLARVLISARNKDQLAHIEAILQDNSKVNSIQSYSPASQIILLDKPEYQNRGPASGILTAHSLYPDDTLLVLAVDFPEADAEALKQLIAGHERNADNLVTCFLHPEDGNPEPVMSIWTPQALERLKENTLKGKSGPCFTAKQLWKEKNPETGMSEGNGLVRPMKEEWVKDADTPEEWENLVGSPPTSILQ